MLVYKQFHEISILFFRQDASNLVIIGFIDESHQMAKILTGFGNGRTCFTGGNPAQDDFLFLLRDIINDGSDMAVKMNIRTKDPLHFRFEIIN